MVTDGSQNKQGGVHAPEEGKADQVLHHLFLRAPDTDPSSPDANPPGGPSWQGRGLRGHRAIICSIRGQRDYVLRGSEMDSTARRGAEHPPCTQPRSGPRIICTHFDSPSLNLSFSFNPQSFYFRCVSSPEDRDPGSFHNVLGKSRALYEEAGRAFLVRSRTSERQPSLRGEGEEGEGLLILPLPPLSRGALS